MSLMVLENMSGSMERHTKENGKMERCKAVDNFFGKKKGNSMKDNTKMM